MFTVQCKCRQLPSFLYNLSMPFRTPCFAQRSLGQARTCTHLIHIHNNTNTRQNDRLELYDKGTRTLLKGSFRQALCRQYCKWVSIQTSYCLQKMWERKETALRLRTKREERKKGKKKREQVTRFQKCIKTTLSRNFPIPTKIFSPCTDFEKVIAPLQS